METNNEFEERIRREPRFAARIRLATERLDEAQRERIWAIVEAHQAGLSVRQIAAATGLSSSRVHQLLGSDEAREIPRWLSQQRRRNRPDRPRQEATRSPFAPDLQACLASELEALRRCREWLERLARVIADLDDLAGYPPSAEEKAVKGEDAEARRVRHRQRLAEPEPPPKRLTRREERAARRALRDLPPSERD